MTATPELLAAALAIVGLVPASVLGAWAGLRMRHGVPAARSFRTVALLLAAIGAALLARVALAAWGANG